MKKRPRVAAEHLERVDGGLDASLAAPLVGAGEAGSEAAEEARRLAAGGASVTESVQLAFSVNFRDISSVSPKLQAGRVFRSSQVLSPSDVAAHGIHTVLDLRQAPVLCSAHHHNVRQGIRHRCAACLAWCAKRAGHGGGEVMEEREGLNRPAPCWRCSDRCACEMYGVSAGVYHVDVLPRTVHFQIMRELPHSMQAKVLWCVVKRGHPEPIVAAAVADPLVMGYIKLYRLILEGAKCQLARAMRLFAERENFPIMVHCIHGKDRTGLVAMLLLLLCEVEEEAIVGDYIRSEVLLRESREKRELLGLASHLTTDQVIAAASHVMEETLDFLYRQYGGARQYLLAAGMAEREVESIRSNLMQL